MILTRRQVLASALTAKAIAGKPGYAPILAAQTFVWTQQFRRQNRTLNDGLEDVIAGTRAAGFERVELMSLFFQPELRERTLELLKKHGLDVPIVYHGGPMHEPAAAEKTIAQTLEVAGVVKDAGTRVLNVNPTPKPKRERKSDEELDAQAKVVSRLAAELKKKDLQLILHHHDPEMAEDGREWRHLLRNTDVGLCVDTHWAFRGGQDPMSIVREAGQRLASAHVRNSQNNTWTEAFGDGDIDYQLLAEYLKQIQYQGFLVIELAHEEDTKITRSLEENLRLSRQYAERVFGI
jgi:inosose dehydratase